MVPQTLVGQGLLIIGLHDHIQTLHTRSSGLGIGLTQVHLPDTQRSQQTDSHAPPAGFEPAIPVRERPQIARPPVSA